jgi:hypothetical protein
MTFAELLPLALVMVIGPQIVTSVFLATSVRWAANSAAFVAGGAVAITAVVTVVYLLANAAGADGGDTRSGDLRRVIDWVVLALILVLIVRVYVTRRRSETPRWMGRLHEANPRFSFRLALTLLGVFPTDIATSIAVGLWLAHAGAPWWQALPFVALTLILLAAPALAVLTLGKRSAVVLPRTRDWMNAHAWLINELVLCFFVVLTLQSISDG